VTVEFAVDLGGGFRWERATVLCFLISNRCIVVKNTFDRNSVVFCVCVCVCIYILCGVCNVWVCVYCVGFVMRGCVYIVWGL
jgi:hypothetical protein